MAASVSRPLRVDVNGIKVKKLHVVDNSGSGNVLDLLKELNIYTVKYLI